MKKLGVLVLFKLFLSSVSAAQTGYDRNNLMQFYQNQEYARAIEYLRPLATGSTDKIQYNNDLGYSYFMNEQYDAALELFRLVYRQQPFNVLANLYMAQIYTDRRESDSAIFYYRNLIYYQPGNYRFWQKVAQAYGAKGQYDSAIIHFQKGYAINPFSGSLVVQYSDALIRQQQLGKADTILQRFLTIDSFNRDVITKRIDVSFRKADYTTAMHWGEKLWKDSADLVSPYINLAYSYLAVDSIDKCIMLIEWLALKKKTTQALTYCEARAWAKKKEYERSNKLLDECLEQSLQNDAVDYFNAKSDNYEAMKQYQKAISYYDTSYYIFQSPLDLYFTGRIYDKYLHNKIKASYYYKLFIDKRKNPRNSGEKRVFDYINDYLKPVN